MNIRFLKAYNGDCIHIEYQDSEGVVKNILIDGGIGKTYLNKKGKKGKPEFGTLKTLIGELRKRGQIIDLLILTHIDDDHIGGFISWIEDDELSSEMIGKVWFNSGELIAEYFNEEPNKDLQININQGKTTNTSIAQGITFSSFLREKGIEANSIILKGQEILLDDLTFNILTPTETSLKKLLKEWNKKVKTTETSSKNDYQMTLLDHYNNYKFKEDRSIPNGSSISFILSWKGKSFLFLGDAHPSDVCESLEDLKYGLSNPLQVEFIKLSHHGSKGSTNGDLLKLIDTKNYIICSDGSSFNHPHKQLLSLIINHNQYCNLCFNYPERSRLIFSEKDFTDYPNFKIHEVNSKIN